MGIVIKEMAKFKNGFVLELNAPQQLGGPKQLHIQNESMRFQLSEEEFLQLAILLLDGEYHLDSYKGNNHER